MELIIITGMSGAGKTMALRVLEDIGYYCVDNIPPKVIPMLASLVPGGGDMEIRKVAVVVDSRSRGIWGSLRHELEGMKKSHPQLSILFLDASTDVLFSRYRESRRRHPMQSRQSPESRLHEAIELEREKLSVLRDAADVIIDTSQTASQQFRERLLGVLDNQHAEQTMAITCMSFGYRNSLPPEADLVFDVRCLPNPFYIPELREHSGDEPCVRDYVMSFPQTVALIGRLKDYLDFTVPLYINEGKSQLVIAIGCTGGKHRSVAVAECLGLFLREKGFRALIVHRDKGRGVLY